MDYTKGPWAWDNFHDTHTALIRTADLTPGDKRAILYHAAEWEMLPADKNLIKAAPDMYEALKDIESKIVDFEAGKVNWRPDDFLLRVRMALRKAEGRTDRG